MGKSRKRAAPLPLPPKVVLYRVDFDKNDKPLVEKLQQVSEKPFMLRDEAGTVVVDAPYLSCGLADSLGSTPSDALEHQRAALELAASHARAELAILERRLAGVAEALASDSDSHKRE